MKETKLIRAFERDSLFFMKSIMPLFYNKPFGVHHRFIINEIKKAKPKEILNIQVHRDSGKTKVISVGLNLWLIMFKNFCFNVVISSSDIKSKQIIDDIKTIIEGDEFIAIFGNCCGKSYGRTWSSHEIEIFNPELGIEAKILSRGAASQVAGLTYKQHRIHFLLMDDLEDPEEVYNVELVDKKERKINEVFMQAVDHEKGIAALIGTPWYHDCQVTRFEKYKHGVRNIKIPNRVNDPKLAEKLGIKVGQSIWEERFSTNYWEEEELKYFENGNLDIYRRQYQLEAMPEGTEKFDEKKIQIFELNEIMDKKLDLWFTVDFAYKTKKWSDRSAICLVGRDSEKCLYVIEAQQGKWGDIRTIDKIIELANKYKDYNKNWILKGVKIESNSFCFVQSHIYERFHKNGLIIGIDELKPKNRHKEDRIKALIPWVETGRYYMRKNQTELRSQMIRFVGREMSQDDIIDALAYQLDIESFPQRIEMTPEEKLEKQRKIFFKFFPPEIRNEEFDSRSLIGSVEDVDFRY